jgi:SAM-dependent methyltransferase
MTAEPFGPAYASLYDELYAGKDYEGEVDLVVEAFRRFGAGETRAVLDVGCGTGGHGLPLARRGYAVTGVDRSAEMLARAREKAAAAGLAVELERGDARSLRLERTFDAVLLLFAVLGYMPGDEDVLAALRTARAHLRPGGLVVLDGWWGPNVVAHPPQDAVREVVHAGAPVRRAATVELDPARHLCTVRYALEGLAGEEEAHVLRYFFEDELERFLAATGFRLLALSAFGALDVPPDADTRTFAAVAEAS